MAPNGIATDGDWVESKDQNPGGEVRLTQLADIGVGHFRDRSNRFLAWTKAEDLNCTILQPNDVLIARMPDPLGRACLFPGLPQPAVTVVDVFVWRSGTELVLPQWIVNAINAPETRRRIMAQASGTTRQRISGGNLKKLPLPLPPLAEQKRIVAKLEMLSQRSARARTELSHVESLVKRYKEAVLAKAFSGELTEDWRTWHDLPAASVGHLEELASVPIRNGLSVRGSNDPPGFAALKLSALRGREVDLVDVRYLPIDEARASKFLVQQGDVLVSRGNGTKALVGIASFVSKVAGPTIFPDTAFRIRPNRRKALPQWLVSIWNAPQVRKQIEGIAKTTAGIWKISQKNLSSIELTVPAVDEQQEIVRRIESTFEKIDRLAAEASRALELVGKLDEAILAKAFRGELVPQDPNDEPANALLERIKAERAKQAPTRGRRKKT